MSNKKIINMGHTNPNKYISNGEFHLEKNINEFNHKIDYTILKEFDFAPKVLENTETHLVTEEIEGAQVIEKFSKEDIQTIGRQMRTIHLSDLKFPKWNLRRRAKQYLKIIHDKGLNIPAIEDNYKEMMLLMSRMKQINPCHNDLWWQNIMKDKNGKIYFVDWEYATRGDKHFDLAYFITAQRLDKNQESILLDAYGENDDYNAHIEEWMPRYKRYCYWLTLCWAYAQEKMPFETDWIIDEMNKLVIKK